MTDLKEFCYHMRKSHLPSDFEHRILEFDAQRKEYIIRSNIKSLSDIEKWIHEFSKKTNTQWNQRNSHPNGSQKIWKEVICHHSCFMKVDKYNNKRGVSKNASCHARIRITIQQLSRRNRNTEFMKTNLWATIRVSKKHTHSLNTAQTLRFLQDKFNKDQDSNIRQVFHEYFLDNMIASEARNHHQRLLELRNASEEELANGRINPTYNTIQYWYKEWRSLNLGPRSGPALISKLEEKKNMYADEGIIVIYEVNPLCVCVITPLMQRAHSLPSSKEHLFIDTTSSCDPGHHSITFLLTSCPAGSIPLGLIITQGQTTEAYTKGFKLFQKAASEFSFCKKGYPKTILTDNSTAEIAAVKTTWPESTHFLCVFHILQTIWRWLHNNDNKIQHDDRTTLMIDFKRILKSEDFEELEIAYNVCLENGTKYPQWIKYVQNYWLFKEKWCLAYRDKKIRGQHTNNYFEANIRIFKDVVLSRVKAYNVISLIDFCAVGLEDYNVTKLSDFAHFRNRRSYLYFQKCLKNKTKYLTKDDIVQVTDDLFLVPSQSNTSNLYSVDCDIGVCSCPEGKFGKFCKHQCAIYEFYELQFVNFPLITTADRYMMAKVALGENSMSNISFHEDFVVEIISNQEIEENWPVRIGDAVSESNCIDNSKFQNYGSVRDNMKSDSLSDEKEDLKDSILQILCDKIDEHETCPDLIAALKQYKKRLNCISTSGTLLNFLHTASTKR